MNMNETILGSIEPDVAEKLADNAEEIAQGRTTSSIVGAGLAMASVPIALAALARDAGAQTPSIVAILNFALKLEIFENEFYKAVLGTSSIAANNTAFAPVRALVPAAAVQVLQNIQKHEQAHVDFLLANGATNEQSLTAASFDFTGGRGSGTGPFLQATTNLQHLLLVTQAAEDTGVRAYKGQAANLMSDSVRLEAALRIHSVEARHAAKIRRLRRANGAPSTVRYSGTISGTGNANSAGADNVPTPTAGETAALNLIYANENNVNQGSPSVDTSNLPNKPTSNFTAALAAGEAFDEPLTKDEVVAIVQGFFIPTLT